MTGEEVALARPKRWVEKRLGGGGRRRGVAGEWGEAGSDGKSRELGWSGRGSHRMWE